MSWHITGAQCDGVQSRPLEDWIEEVCCSPVVAEWTRRLFKLRSGSRLPQVNREVYAFFHLRRHCVTESTRTGEKRREIPQCRIFASVLLLSCSACTWAHRQALRSKYSDLGNFKFADCARLKTTKQNPYCKLHVPYIALVLEGIMYLEVGLYFSCFRVGLAPTSKHLRML